MYLFLFHIFFCNYVQGFHTPWNPGKSLEFTLKIPDLEIYLNLVKIKTRGILHKTLKK